MMFKSCLLASFLLSQVLCQAASPPVLPTFPSSRKCAEGQEYCYCGEEGEFCFSACKDGTCISEYDYPDENCTEEVKSNCFCDEEYCVTECNDGVCKSNPIEACEEGGKECYCAEGTEQEEYCGEVRACRNGICVYTEEYLARFPYCSAEDVQYCKCEGEELCLFGTCVEGVCTYVDYYEDDEDEKYDKDDEGGEDGQGGKYDKDDEDEEDGDGR